MTNNCLPGNEDNRSLRHFQTPPDLFDLLQHAVQTMAGSITDMARITKLIQQNAATAREEPARDEHNKKIEASKEHNNVKYKESKGIDTNKNYASSFASLLAESQSLNLVFEEPEEEPMETMQPGQDNTFSSEQLKSSQDIEAQSKYIR